MGEPAPPPLVERQSLDPKRHPAALAGAITEAWRPYRWRAYGAGILAGLFVGGVLAPIATTSLLLALYLAGAADPDGVPWFEGVWSIAFALTVPVVGATVFARWQPRRFRMAAQTYVWLATRAEKNWARVFGAQPVPRDEAGTRAVLASIPESPETAGERFGLWIALVELDRARAAAAGIPEKTAHDRYTRAAAFWLADFIAGTTHPLESLQPLADAIDEPDQQLEAAVTIAVNRARVALSEGKDWQAPLAAARDRLGTSAGHSYDRLIWWPTFRTLIISTSIGVTVFWLALVGLGPYFPRIAARYL
jgi:hypothetical protein